MLRQQAKTLILFSGETLGVAALFFLLGISPAAFGETSSLVQFGIKSGLGISDFYGDESRLFDQMLIEDSLKPSARLAIPLGLSLSARLNQYWALGLELFYSPKGKKYRYSLTIDDVTGTLDYVVKANYLELPVLVKFFVPGDKEFNLHFYAGIAPAFLTAAEEYMKIEVEGEKYRDTTTSFYKYCTRFDYGVVFGAGGFVPEETIDVTLDVRCTMGFPPLFKRERYELVEIDLRNWQIMVLLGFVMRLSKVNYSP